MTQNEEQAATFLHSVGTINAVMAVIGTGKPFLPAEVVAAVSAQIKTPPDMVAIVMKSLLDSFPACLIDHEDGTLSFHEKSTPTRDENMDAFRKWGRCSSK